MEVWVTGEHGHIAALLVLDGASGDEHARIEQHAHRDHHARRERDHVKRIEIDELTVRKLRVETPYLVAVIKGTQFNVAVTGDTSTISLHEGVLE